MPDAYTDEMLYGRPDGVRQDGRMEREYPVIPSRKGWLAMLALPFLLSPTLTVGAIAVGLVGAGTFLFRLHPILIAFGIAALCFTLVGVIDVIEKRKAARRGSDERT